ncbi:hypothetical protein QYE76_032106 [Lolium multiflorum]|uniref:CCHC-type domain-containing protein n=1 Tax=Lolium multiflorum TaxID=4521 RepID=A0AAD8VL02_LOLMU|nr:hypothetical protein QYE76_032106 [Lolium multiflorum]
MELDTDYGSASIIDMPDIEELDNDYGSASIVGMTDIEELYIDNCSTSMDDMVEHHHEGDIDSTMYNTGAPNADMLHFDELQAQATKKPMAPTLQDEDRQGQLKGEVDPSIALNDTMELPLEDDLGGDGVEMVEHGNFPSTKEAHGDEKIEPTPRCVHDELVPIPCEHERHLAYLSATNSESSDFHLTCEIECFHLEEMSETPSSMDVGAPMMDKKMYMVQKDHITPCFDDDDDVNHVEHTTTTIPTSIESDYQGTRTTTSTATEHELTKRAIESYPNKDEIHHPTREIHTNGYVVHQDPGEEDTPWSREGEEQLDVKMDVKMDVELDPTSCEARQGREGASRPRTRSDRTPDRAVRSKPDSPLMPTGRSTKTAGPPPVQDPVWTGRAGPRSGEEAREDGVLRNTERLATQHNLWAQRQEFKEQLALFETRIDEQYDEVANNFTIVNQDMTLLREATDNLNGQMAANDANMERRMDSLERAINNLGMETIIVLIDIMIAMKTHAQTLDVESFIAMLVLMNVLRKKKYYNKLAINMIAMPTMGVTINPTTTSSTTWNRHLIVSHMLMLKTKVIKIHRGVIFGIILAITNMGEENRQMHKMREPSMNVVTNLAKIFDNTIIVNQVKLVFNFNTNPMLWNLEDKENMYGKLKFNMPKFKGEDDAEAYLSWALKVDKIFRIHNYSGAKKVAMASLEFEDYANTWFFNGLNYPIKRIVEFQQYSNMVELVHQASKAERQVNEDIKYSKSKQYFASKLATPTPTTSVKPSVSSTPSKQPTIQSCMKQTVTSTASSKASTGPSNVTCFKCGTQGHKSFECKNTKIMITMENGDIETLSEGEYEALVQAAVANEEDYNEESGEDRLLCVHDTSPSLVVTRVLTTQPQALEDQRCNIFQTRAGIGGKSIKVIIDGGSCHNLASTEMCEKLNLTLRKHPHPYHVQWLSDKGNVKIQHTVTVNLKIGPYEDTVECDVVPMTVCHMLLGRPWQYDNKVIHDGHSNVYTFKVKDKKFELRPMTSSQIIADNAKEFQDVFPDELPHGLPPLRGIEHRIDLIPGAPLPYRAAYRTNPEDTKEIQRQIQDLLAKGYVVHQDPGEEDTPWSREGEEQLDVKMDVELDPTSCEARQGREGASRPRTRSDRTPDRAVRSKPDSPLMPTGPSTETLGPPPVTLRSRTRFGPDAPAPGPV